MRLESSPVEWSEVEVLLEEEKQPSVRLSNPKYILYGAGIIVLIVCILFAIKFFSASTRDVPAIPSAPSRPSTITPSSGLNPSAHSSAFSKLDSSPEIISPKSPAADSEATTIKKQKAHDSHPVHEKKEDAESPNRDPGFIPDKSLDSAEENKSEEIKTETTPAITEDTTNVSFWKKIRRKRARKQALEETETTPPTNTRPDSLR